MRAALALVWLAALAAAAPAAASPREFVFPICIEDVRQLPVWVREIPIPVGCEIIDCCPGCPGPGPLDWQVRVGGAALSSVGVRFEGLAPGPIKVEGDARPTPDGAVIGPRGATLRNLGGERDQVPFANLELGLDAAVLEKLAQSPGGTDEDLGEIDVAIDQRLGPVIVNEFRHKVILRHCKVAPIESCDQIVQQDNFGADRSVLQLDARRSSGCSQDEQHRSDAVTKLDNVLSPDASCPSGELAVYSDDNAMWIKHPSAGFTDVCGDRIPADLKPVLRAPVSIWLARPLLKSAPAIDAANADWIYDDENKVGVIFDVEQNDLSSDRAATEAASLWCVGLSNLRSAGHYDAGRLNVYYSLFPMTGQVCPQDPNAIFVGSWANVATLAHEFGHTFTLQHTNGLTGFTIQNLMEGGGPATRDRLTLGQAFRVNVDTRSSLNVNHVRNDHVRPCAASGGDCPRLELDWSRP